MKYVAVLDMPVAVKQFVESGLWRGEHKFGECTAIGFGDDKVGLVAGVVYHDYNPDYGSIEMSAFSTVRDWTTRDNIALIFGKYPLLQLSCRVIVGRHSEHNHRARRIWKNLGASEHLLPELRGPDEAEVVALLKRETFLNSKYMQV